MPLEDEGQEEKTESNALEKETSFARDLSQINMYKGMVRECVKKMGR